MHAYLPAAPTDGAEFAARGPDGTLPIALLGGFRVAAGPRTVAEAARRRRKAKALVKLPALTPAHRLHREQLMERLWPAVRPLDPLGQSSACLRAEDQQAALEAGGAAWIDVAALSSAASARFTVELLTDQAPFHSDAPRGRGG